MENSDRLMYISVQDGSRSWCSRWDMQVNPQHYSCVTIKEDETSRISVFPANPVPRWIQNNKGDASFPSDAVKVHQRSDNVVVYMYLAKVNYNPDVLVQLVAAAPLGLGPSGTYGYPVSHWGLDRKWKVMQDEKTGSCSTRDRQVCCSRTIVGEKIWMCESPRGNIIPPNAAKTTLLFDARPWERYVERVDSKYVCAVSIIDGMIGYSTDINGSKTTSGDIFFSWLLISLFSCHFRSLIFI